MVRRWRPFSNRQFERFSEKMTIEKKGAGRS
jgi:hypothetical protein